MKNVKTILCAGLLAATSLSAHAAAISQSGTKAAGGGDTAHTVVSTQNFLQATFAKTQPTAAVQITSVYVQPLVNDDAATVARWDMKTNADTVYKTSALLIDGANNADYKAVFGDSATFASDNAAEYEAAAGNETVQLRVVKNDKAVATGSHNVTLTLTGYTS